MLALLLTACLLFAAGCAGTTKSPVESAEPTAAATPSPTPSPTAAPTPEPTETPEPTPAPKALERMQAPVGAVVFYCLEHEMSYWEPTVTLERAFSTVFGVYGQFYYSLYGFGTAEEEQIGGFQIVPEADVIAAACAMFPDFSGSPKDYLPGLPADGEMVHSMYDEATQQYGYLLANAWAGIGDQLECVENADGSLDVTYQIRYFADPDDGSTCRVHMTPFTAPDQNADYYAYTIQSVSIMRP